MFCVLSMDRQTDSSSSQLNGQWLLARLLAPLGAIPACPLGLNIENEHFCSQLTEASRGNWL